MLLQRLRWAVVGLFLVLVGGTTGYHLLEGWSWIDSLWMVIITLTTIGYGEPAPLSSLGRLYTVGLIVVGVGLGTYIVTRLTRYMVEGEWVRDLVARRRRRQMHKLQDHFIVVGYGRLGREVSAELLHRKKQVVAIDIEEPPIDHLRALAMFIHGDGGNDDTLTEAAVQRARGLAVATGSEAMNILVTLSARQMNPGLNILTRVDEEGSASKALRAGASTVIKPYTISGSRMAQGLLHPHAALVLDRAVGRAHQEFNIEDIRIGKNDDYNGLLGDLRIPERHKVLLVAVQKPDGTLLTATDRATELCPGDVAVVVGRPADIVSFAEAAADKPG